MAFQAMRFLSARRLSRILGTLASQLEIDRPLVYLRRLPLVPAFDDELFGRFTGRLLAADIVADDQKALVHEAIELELHTQVLPNIKVGERLPQKLINRIKALEEGGMSPAGENALRNWDMQLAERILQQVRQRQNHIAAGMMLDDFSYDRFGIKVTTATWGMPANLKVTPSIAWSNAGTATPLNDIWGVEQVARFEYGIEFDTVTMSTVAFRNMVATTEFSNKASIPLSAAFLVPSTALPTRNDPEMLRIAGRILNKTIEIDDAVMRVKNADGSETTTRYLPENKVLLSRSMDHGSGDAYDMANAIVTESIVASMIGGPEGIPNESYGPIGYYTGNYDLNPPDLVCWGVAKSFARKFIPEATAVMTVG